MAVKIFHVIVDLDVGGAETMLKRLIESNSTSIPGTVVVSLTTSGVIGESLSACGVRVHTLGLRSAFDIPLALWQLVRLIRANRPDIVQTWMYHADLLGGVAARFAGVKNIIWGVRTTEINEVRFGTTNLVRKVCAWLSNSVPRFIVCAAEASRKSHVAFGYDARRMIVIPNGFDLARFVNNSWERFASRDKFGFGEHEVVVGFLGRFHADKDQASFIRAAGMVASHHPSSRFLMIGRDLVAANVQLENWIKATGYAERFVLLGERSDVPACLAAMDIFCLSSRTEGFPNVVGEAMAMGLPCVVTDVGDAAMLVSDTGLVVPKENAMALAGGMARLLAMPLAERVKLGQRAKARIYSDFSMERARERFEALYLQMTRRESN